MINGPIRKYRDPDYEQIAIIFHNAVHELEAKDYNLKQLYSEVSITARPFFDRHGFVYSRDNKVERNGVEFLNTIMVYDL